MTMETELDLKTIRINRSVTRASLAETLGVDITTVCRWEKHGIPERGAGRNAIKKWVEEWVAEVEAA